ncbi:ABC transporter permease [Bacillus tianshenii]|nr:ABC transporter permease [Bacillus tianshenii]
MRKIQFSSILLLTFFFVGWEVASTNYNKPYLFPSPTAIITKCWELREPLLLEHLPATFTVIVVGLLLSLLFGIALSVAMSQYVSVEKAIYPLLISSQTIPIIALAPIFVLWFGYSIWSKVAVTVLITFFPITVGLFDGLKATDKEWKELMITMGATKKDIFLKLEVPAAMPSFFSGMKVAVTLSVIGAAIGEWLGADAGLGYFSRRMMTQFDGPGVFAPIVLLSLLGIFLFLFVNLCEKIALKWRGIG